MAYQIPRNVKGEGRILFIFSTKALITSGIRSEHLDLSFGGYLEWWEWKQFWIVITIAFAVIGFGIGTLKVPNTTAFEVTRKTSGENIDDVILRWLKFKFKAKKKIYVYTEGGTKDDR